MSVCIPFYNVLPHMCGASAVSTIVQGKKIKKLCPTYYFPQGSDYKLAEHMSTFSLYWRTRILVSNRTS